MNIVQFLATVFNVHKVDALTLWLTCWLVIVTGLKVTVDWYSFAITVAFVYLVGYQSRSVCALRRHLAFHFLA